MSYQIVTDFAGQVGVNPRLVRMISTDTLATITTAGYINPAAPIGVQLLNTDFVFCAYSGGQGIFSVSISYTNGTPIITLVVAESGVITPTVINDIAVFANTEGTIKDAAGVTAAAGGLQAGFSGTAGVVTSYPATASKGTLVLAAVNNTGNTATTISNAAMGQASVVSIPDPGSATANFIISKSSGTQHITSGALSEDAGIISSGLAAGGFVGELQLFPTTASKGSLAITATANTGNTATSITNAAMGQASALTIPDPGAASANFVLDHGTTTMAAGSSIVLAKVNGTEATNAVTASGQSGVITTSSLNTAGGGSYAITWTNTFISSTSTILLSIMGGTNTTENITLKATAGTGTSTLTIYNNTAATALNGTIFIGYAVF